MLASFTCLLHHAPSYTRNVYAHTPCSAIVLVLMPVHKCMHWQNAKPEDFNMPLAIILGLITLPAYLVRSLYRLTRPMLPSLRLERRFRLFLDALCPPPMVEETIALQTAGGAATGIYLVQGVGRFGCGTGAPHIARVDAASVFTNLLKVGDELVSINGVAVTSCSEVATMLRDAADLEVKVRRIDRIGLR